MTPGNAQLLIGGAAVQRCLHDYTLHEVNMITLNRILRAAAGVGLVAQHAYVDAAAQAHSNYLAANDLTGHYEISTNTGWTGDTPADRIQAAGYGANSPWEVIAYANTTGADFVDMLVAA